MCAITCARFKTAVDFVGQERRVRIDGEEVAGSFDHIFLGFSESGEQVAERGFQRRGIIAVGPWPTEPSDAEVEVSLSSFFISSTCGIGFVVVTTVLECDASAAFELGVVPFRHFGMCEDGVVAAEEAGAEAAGDVVGGWVVLTGWVAGILPIVRVRSSGSWVDAGYHVDRTYQLQY